MHTPYDSETTVRPSSYVDRFTGQLDYQPNETLNSDALMNNFSDFACITLMLENTMVQMSHSVFIYASTVFVVIGLIGNFLSMLVFWSPEMRGISSNVYLFMLSISDSAYLLTVFFTKIITTLRCRHFPNSTMDFYNRSTLFCKLLQFLMDLLSDYSTCLILAFTVERYLACYHALKFRQFSSTLRARIFCASMLLVIVIITLPYHLMYIGRYPNIVACLIYMDHEAIFVILYAIEAFAFRILPVFTITILNVLISIKVIKLHRKRKAQRARTQESHCLTNKGQVREGRRWSLEERHIQITFMLIVVSTSYVVLYFPVMVHFIMLKVQRLKEITTWHDAMTIFGNIAKTLYVGGFAINFVLYTVSCKAFREQLVHVLSGYKNMYAEVKVRSETSGANVHNGITDNENPKTTHTHV